MEKSKTVGYFTICVNKGVNNDCLLNQTTVRITPDAKSA